MTGFVYLWEFQVKPGLEAEFELHYGPGGTWAQLFHGSPDFIETLLLKDKAVPGRYITVDHWRSEAAYQAFRSAFTPQYGKLDKECEQLTVNERLLGTYTT